MARGTVLDGLDVVIVVIADPNIEHLVPMLIPLILGRVDVVRSDAVDVDRNTDGICGLIVGARFARHRRLVPSVDFHAFLERMVKTEWYRKERCKIGFGSPPVTPHCPLADPWEAAAASWILDGGRKHSRTTNIEDLIHLAWLARRILPLAVADAETACHSQESGRENFRHERHAERDATPVLLNDLALL